MYLLETAARLALYSAKWQGPAYVLQPTEQETHYLLIEFVTFVIPFSHSLPFSHLWGFGYGESEYELSFGIAPRNGE